MITQEMVDVAEKAIGETYPDFAQPTSFSLEAKAALIAVYPLILEEVAKFYDECDERIIAQTIRNMKDKTDE